MKWSEICIHTTQEAVEPISNILHEAGSSGVVIEDPLDLTKDWNNEYGEVYKLSPEDYPEEGVNIKAYLPVNSFLGETVEQIKEAINNLLLYDIDLGSNKITISEINEEEWATAWKKYYKPVKISKRITITPTWEAYEPVDSDEVIIELDPGMAFGTGTHPTTVLCIQAIEKVMTKHNKILDVGTGSGILSIAAARLGAEQVLAVDLDDVAVKAASINVKLNKVQDIVTVKQNNLVDNIEEPVDIMIANLLAEIVIRLADGAEQLVKPNGYLIASGIIKTKKQEVKDVLENHHFKIIETLEMEDWIAIVAQREPSN